MENIRYYMQRHLQENRTLYAFVCVLFLMGVIFGAIIVNSLSLNQKQDLYTYLSRFFIQASEGGFASKSDMLFQSFGHYLKYMGLMWLLGLSVIGLPVILIMLFLKGVVMGFTVGFLVNQMGWYGFLLSFVSVLPQNVLLIPAFIIVSVAAIAFSIKMIRQLAFKHHHVPFFPQLIRYTVLVAGVGVMVFLASSLEAFFTPALMEQVIKWSIH
ncbi:stage II sporulation protein M [Fictibacillus barbaricus]|uniref:Stage II sporulation protein M n=1 Tax=Fictibacillus barbaricus TaxID=182136 RepID=A0ABU1TZM6_9BACL|nr:stage II sporulation protein M [Fictibacillus barbaricus]MDR7072620.1 stage II sporulation protein M [Fictibacillus barbaricus]